MSSTQLPHLFFVRFILTRGWAASDLTNLAFASFPIWGTSLEGESLVIKERPSESQQLLTDNFLP